MIPEGTGKRNFGLDLVRACAILMVLINHSVYLLFPLRQLPYTGYALGKIFALTVPFGLIGVEPYCYWSCCWTGSCSTVLPTGAIFSSCRI